MKTIIIFSQSLIQQINLKRPIKAINQLSFQVKRNQHKEIYPQICLINNLICTTTKIKIYKTLTSSKMEQTRAARRSMGDNRLPWLASPGSKSATHRLATGSGRLRPRTRRIGSP